MGGTMVALFAYRALQHVTARHSTPQHDMSDHRKKRLR